MLNGKRDIKERFQAGFGDFMAEGIVLSRAIKEVLPFTLFERTKDENPLVFDSFQSDKYDKRKELSKKDIVSEFLKGDLRFVNDVDGILNFI